MPMENRSLMRAAGLWPMAIPLPCSCNEKSRGSALIYGLIRNGEWEFVAYHPDGTYSTPPSGTGSSPPVICRVPAARRWRPAASLSPPTL